MKAYCINLDRRPDRLDHMMGQFGRHGMPFERIPAVDCQRPEVAAEATKCLPTSLGPRISAAAYACFQSHREAWRRLVASGESHGLILEDDLLLADGIAEYLGDGWVPPDADLVRLETFGTRLHVDAAPMHRVGSRQLRRLRSSHLGAACYVIASPAARRLFEATALIREPVDVVLFSERSAFFDRLVTYQMVPAPAVQGKRPASDAREADWSATSITERFEPDMPLPAQPAETPLLRLTRRVAEALEAHRHGTRYIVIPHG